MKDISFRIPTAFRVHAILVSGMTMCLPATGQSFLNKSEEFGVSGGNEACWFDMNNDGWVDLCAGGKVYRNRAGKAFVHVADTGAVVAADYDNDGYVDLYSWSGRTMYHNDGGTGFTAVPLPELPVGSSLGAAWMDYDNDGYVDLYVGGYEAWPDATYADFILKNRRGRGWVVTWSEVRFRARGVTACDYDRDGDMDVYVSNYRLQPNILWQNQGDGTFRDVTGEYNALATDRGFGGGHSIGSVWADFDSDGHIDLFAGNFAHNDGRGHQPESHWLRNRGPAGDNHFEDLGQRGVFYQESYSSPAAGDYDNDGDLDLFFTTVYGVASFGVPNNPVLFRNDGAINFGDATGEAGLSGLPPTYQGAWADYDNDGDLDLMAAGALFENQGGTGHSWLKVRLIGDGAKVNRAAIGGQVRVAMPGGKILTRHVEAGTGQGNANDLTLHFGLGTHRDPVDLEVFWPDGTTQIIGAVALDQMVTLHREPLAEIVQPTKPVALEVGAGLVLVGRATEEEVSFRWSAESVPNGGRVDIDDPTALQTTVHFTEPGDYFLRLTGEKGGITTFDRMTITVWPDGPRGRPLAWWKLNERSGEVVRDSSGYRLHGTRMGFAEGADGWGAEGVRHGALSFLPGNGEFVDLESHAGSLKALKEGTLSIWFRSDSGSEHPLFSLSTGRGGEEVGLSLRDGFLEFRTRLKGDPAAKSLRSQTRVNDGLWHHAAVSCEQTVPLEGEGGVIPGVATLYLDGRRVAFGRLPFFSSVPGADQVAIGRAMTGEGIPQFFGGELDEVRIYPRALSSAEVAGLQAATGGAEGAPLIVLPGDRITVPSQTFPLAGFGPFVEDGVLERWEQVSGPGAVTFSSPTQRLGDVSFPVPGTYVLRVLARNSAVTTTRDLTVVHTGGASGSPASFGIADLSLSQAPTAHEIALGPVFHDPDHGDALLTYSVTVAPGGEELLEFARVAGGGVAGPGQLMLRATSDREGTAQVTVRAEDPAGNVTETSFTVTVTNSAPLASDLSLAIDENPTSGQVLARVPAFDFDNDPIRFHLDSGNSDEAFGIDAVTGELRVLHAEAVDFERHPRFDLRVAVSDVRHPVPDQLVAVTIEVNDLPETPVLRAERWIVSRDAPVNALIGIVTGSDPDGDPLTYSVADGDPGGVFALDPGSGELTLADPAGLGRQPRFDLLVRGTDLSGAEAEAVITVLPTQTIVPEGSTVRWKVPIDDSEDPTWRELVHNDRAWSESSLPLGYDTSPDYLPLLATDLDASMRGQNTSVYVRLRFRVDDPGSLGPLILRLRYDDGFAAYLNGRLVAGRFLPESLDWQSGASAGHPDSEAMQFEEFDLGQGHHLLEAGENVLAIHGLNHLLTSSDFLLAPELVSAARDSGVVLLPEGSMVRWKVPADGSDDEFWTEESFDDTGWAEGPMALGYDEGANYLPHIATDVTGEMHDLHTGVYLRARFDVPDPSALTSLRLRMKYDDGFVAYLNGLLVGGGNDPPLAELDWQSEATQGRDDGEAVQFQEFALEEALRWLVPGENVLAIHGLNYLITSSDFLMSAEVVAQLGTPFPSGPARLNQAGVSEVGSTSARVHCEVSATGGVPVHLIAVWGRRDYGLDPERWPNRAFAGTVEATRSLSVVLRNLEAGHSYEVRFYAQRPEDGEIAGWSGAAGFGTPEMILAAERGPMQALIPTSDQDAPGWRERDFFADPTRWLEGSSGAGFDRTGSFASAIGLDLNRRMHRVNASAYLRVPFLSGDPAGLDSLKLRMKYDDGFVAYLNGVEIARANAPTNLLWNSVANGLRVEGEAETVVEFDVTASLGALAGGPNVLAIHGLNQAPAEPDFLIAPELVASGKMGAISSYQSWAFANGHYGGDARPESDRDGNGRSNFEEFASVKLVEFGPLPGDAFLLRYQRRAGLQDVVQMSENLVDWWTVVPSASVVELLEDGEFELATLRITSPGAQGETLFVRIVTSGSGGVSSSLQEVILVDEFAPARALVPSSEVSGWTQLGFDDQSWQSGSTGVGYEHGSGYQDLIALDLEPSMAGVNTSAYVRIPFTVVDPSVLEGLTLRMKYDDGFVAYLNGVRVAAANAGSSEALSWQAGAPGTHDDSLALQFEDFDLTDFQAALVPGNNVLAIHALNAGLGSSDLLILPQLVANEPRRAFSPYDRWALLSGLSGSTAKPEADPEHDGVKNFAEFGHGSDPQRFDREGFGLRVVSAAEGSGLEVTFRRGLEAAAAGIAFEVQSSADLRTWQAADQATEVAVRLAPDRLAELVTVRIRTAVGASGFVRLVMR